MGLGVAGMLENHSMYARCVEAVCVDSDEGNTRSWALLGI
jgi:hypothetical protein